MRGIFELRLDCSGGLAAANGFARGGSKHSGGVVFTWREAVSICVIIKQLAVHLTEKSGGRGTVEGHQEADNFQRDREVGAGRASSKKALKLVIGILPCYLALPSHERFEAMLEVREAALLFVDSLYDPFSPHF